MHRIVGIGGGTGLPILLKGLVRQRDVNVSAVVSVSDNGGSSGKLRKGFGIPAVGDLRNCMVALSDWDSDAAPLFQHRFPSGGCLEGHALGNLIVTALHQKSGSLARAIELAERIMPLRGKVSPVTEVDVTLCAAFRDGSQLRGECEIAAAGREIERVWLEPESPPPSVGVLESLRAADAIVLAPGSLYTSLIPNLLVDGVAESIQRSRGVKIYVCNLMTQPGETDGYAASDHLRALEKYLGPDAIDYCIVDSATQANRRKPVRSGELVMSDWEGIRAARATPVPASLVDTEGPCYRHDPDKLARLVTRLVSSTAVARLASSGRSVSPAVALGRGRCAWEATEA